MQFGEIGMQEGEIVGAGIKALERGTRMRDELEPGAISFMCLKIDLPIYKKRIIS